MSTRASSFSADDEAACVRLGVAFANHIDARRYAQVLDLFTEDGVLDRMGAVTTGRAALAAFLEARPAGVETRHVCTNFLVEPESADEARGASYALFFQGSRAGPDDAVATMAGLPAVVEYHDRFARTARGWRIRERVIRMALRPAPLSTATSKE